MSDCVASYFSAVVPGAAVKRTTMLITCLLSGEATLPQGFASDEWTGAGERKLRPGRRGPGEHVGDHRLSVPGVTTVAGRRERRVPTPPHRPRLASPDRTRSARFGGPVCGSGPHATVSAPPHESPKGGRLLMLADDDSEAPRTSPGNTPQERGTDMVLDGVPIDDRVVRDIAAVVGKPLAQKLEQALFFSAEVVALTPTEKDAVLAALDRMPWEYEEVRELLLAGPSSSESHAMFGETGIALEVDRGGDAPRPSILYLEAVAHHLRAVGTAASRLAPCRVAIVLHARAHDSVRLTPGNAAPPRRRGIVRSLVRFPCPLVASRD